MTTTHEFSFRSLKSPSPFRSVSTGVQTGVVSGVVDEGAGNEDDVVVGKVVGEVPGVVLVVESGTEVVEVDATDEDVVGAAVVVGLLVEVDVAGTVDDGPVDVVVAGIVVDVVTSVVVVPSPHGPTVPDSFTW